MGKEIKILEANLPSLGGHSLSVPQTLELNFNNAMVNLKAEFNERALRLKTKTDQAQEDYKVMSAISASITEGQKDGIRLDASKFIIEHVGSLTMDTVLNSLSIREFAKLASVTMATGAVVETLTYFFRQLRGTSQPDPILAYQIASNIISQQGDMTYGELLFVLNAGVTGRYGKIFGAVDMQVVFQWIAEYMSTSAAYQEVKVTRDKATGVQHVMPWTEEEKQLKEFERKEKQKADIRQKVWSDDRAKQVQQFKDETLNPKTDESNITAPTVGNTPS